MIPWFVVNALGVVCDLFGIGIAVRARSHSWGAERLYFYRFPADAVKLPTLKRQRLV